MHRTKLVNSGKQLVNSGKRFVAIGKQLVLHPYFSKASASFIIFCAKASAFSLVEASE